MPRKKQEGIYSRVATAFIIVFEDETELRAFFMKKGSPISLSVPFFFWRRQLRHGEKGNLVLLSLARDKRGESAQGRLLGNR